MATFRDRFRTLLADARVSHQTAAAVCGLSVQTVHYLSSGRRENPEPDTLRAIATGFGVSTDWLLGLSDEGPDAKAVRARVTAAGHPLKECDDAEPASPAEVA